LSKAGTKIKKVGKSVGKKVKTVGKKVGKSTKLGL